MWARLVQRECVLVEVGHQGQRECVLVDVGKARSTGVCAGGGGQGSFNGSVCWWRWVIRFNGEVGHDRSRVQRGGAAYEG